MRGATRNGCLILHISEISTHTPHAGRDLTSAALSAAHLRFLLTRPMRGATASCSAGPAETVFLLTRPMRGATGCAERKRYHGEFLLTRPMRGATASITPAADTLVISTHTPHAGRDMRSGNRRRIRRNFYSHAPCGARPGIPFSSRVIMANFYSHAPCGARLFLALQQPVVQRHTPHAGRDSYI